MSIELAEQPKSNTQLIARSLKLYWSSLIHVFGLALFLGLIIWISGIISEYLLYTNAKIIYIDLFVFLASVLGLFIFTTLLWRMRCVLTHTHDSILDDITIASKKIFLIIGATLIQLVMFSLFATGIYFLSQLFQKQPPIYAFYLTMIAFVVLFVTFFYFYYALIFYLPLILTENKGIFSAMGKSISLVWGNWWRVFFLQILPVLSYIIFIAILTTIFQIDIKLYFSTNYTYIIASVINLFVIALFIPFNGAILLIQLRDLELRKEEKLSESSAVISEKPVS